MTVAGNRDYKKSTIDKGRGEEINKKEDFGLYKNFISEEPFIPIIIRIEEN